MIKDYLIIAECWIVPPAINLPGVLKLGGNQYPRMQIQNKKYLISHLVKLIQINTGTHDPNSDGSDYLLFPGKPRTVVDLSHLCHRKQCINPLHLLFELRLTNVQRESCKKKRRCLRHHGGPDCLFNTISHPLVFDQAIDLGVDRGRPKKQIGEKTPEITSFTLVTPFNHTGLEYPFP